MVVAYTVLLCQQARGNKQELEEEQESEGQAKPEGQEERDSQGQGLNIKHLRYHVEIALLFWILLNDK